MSEAGSQPNNGGQHEQQSNLLQSGASRFGSVQNLVTPLTREPSRSRLPVPRRGQLTTVTSSTSRTVTPTTAAAGSSASRPNTVTGPSSYAQDPHTTDSWLRRSKLNQSNLRRCISTSSLYLHNSTANTTPSYGNMSRLNERTISSGAGAAANKVKIPGLGERDLLDNMVATILYVVKDVGRQRGGKYPLQNSPDVHSFYRLSSTDVQKYFVYFLDLFYPKNPKQTDLVAYITETLPKVEGISCLPTLSKSHFKSIAPHQWPLMITALAYMACYTSEFYGCFQEQDESTPEDEKFKKEIAKYREIMTSLKESKITLEQAKESYRAVIEDIYDEDKSTTVEQLQEQLDERQAVLRSLMAEKDPRDEANAVLERQEEILQTERDRQTTLMEDLHRFNNLVPLQSEETVLNCNLQRLLREQRELEAKLKAQGMTKEEAERKVHAIAEIKDQSASLKSVLKSLKKELARTNKFLENNKKKFYEVCKGFDALDSYNSNAEKITEKIPNLVSQLERNPFDHQGLKKWLKKTRQKIQRDKKRLEAKKADLTKLESELNAEMKSMDDYLAELDSKYEEFSARAKQKGQESDERQAKLATKIQSVQAELEMAKAEVKRLSDEVTAKTAELEQIDTSHLDTLIAEMQAKAEETGREVESLHAHYTQAEVNLKSYLLAAVTEARAKVHAPITEEELEQARKRVHRLRAEGNLSSKRDNNHNDTDGPPGPGPSGASTASSSSGVS